MRIQRVLTAPRPVMLGGMAHDFQRSPDFLVKVCVSNGNDALAAVHKCQLGVPGLVFKDKSRQVLARCIHTVHQGGKWPDRNLTMKTTSLFLEQQKKNAKASSLLTPREMMVACMVTKGWTNKKIASKLFISEGTTKRHLHHIYQKLNCREHLREAPRIAERINAAQPSPTGGRTPFCPLGCNEWGQGLSGGLCAESNSGGARFFLNWRGKRCCQWMRFVWSDTERAWLQK